MASVWSRLRILVAGTSRVKASRKQKQRRQNRALGVAFVECLEVRFTLSALPGTEVHTDLMRFSAHSNAVPNGITPAQIQAAYGFDKVMFGSVKGDGSGQTIAIVDAYNDPTILNDLAIFDSQFGLPAPPSIKVVNQTGGTTLPRNDSGWAGEIALDVEWAHAVALGANILLVEANSNSTANLDKAEDYARNAPGVVVVSNSWGGGEYSTESSEDVHFTTPSGHTGVTFTVASGDDGTGAEYPSSSPNVLSVGGSTLRLGGGGSWSSEAVWSGGGGGTSKYEKTPSYQSGLGLTRRGTPDVSYDADPSTGFAVYDSYGDGGWVVFGGTSAGAPQWAGLIAIADQGRSLAGLGSIGNAQAALYSLPRSDFHDIISGSNGVSPVSGYDLASGLGSPIANLVIADLVGSNSGGGGSDGSGGAVTLDAPSINSLSTSSATTAQISWSSGSSGSPSGFRILVTNLGTGVTTTIGPLGASIRSATINNLTPGALESFTVEAFDAAGNTADSVAQAITMPSLALLTAPTIDTVQSKATSPTTVQIVWSGGAGAAGYRILQVNGDGSTTSLGSVGASVTSATVSNLTPGSTVKLAVEAFDSSGGTADSASWSVTLPAQTGLQSPQVTATATSSTRVLLSWNKVTGAQGYRIYWWNGRRAVWIGSAGSKATSVTITGLSPGTTNQFLVEAYGGGQVADSAWVSVLMPRSLSGRAKRFG